MERPGWKTTEFWVTIIVIVAATALLLTDKIDAGLWAVAAGLPGMAYPVSRGLAKKKGS